MLNIKDACSRKITGMDALGEKMHKGVLVSDTRPSRLITYSWLFTGESLQSEDLPFNSKLMLERVGRSEQGGKYVQD